MKTFQHKSASQLLHDIAQSIAVHGQTHIHLKKLVDISGRRTFSLIIIIFSVLNILPVAMVPGFAVLTAIPILFVSLQLITARQHLWLPRYFGEKKLPTAPIVRALEKSITWFRQLEHLLKPRLQWLFTPVGVSLLGCVLGFLCILLLLPIPFSNNILGFLLLLFALSLLEYDGLLLIIALSLSATYVVFISKVALALIKLVPTFFA